MSDNMIPVYDKTTGKKRRIPPHWLDVFPGLFRKTPLSEKQAKEAAARTVDASKVEADAAADALARQAANRTGVLPQPDGAVGQGAAPTDSTNGDTNPPANGATTEGA